MIRKAALRKTSPRSKMLPLEKAIELLARCQVTKLTRSIPPFMIWLECSCMLFQQPLQGYERDSMFFWDSQPLLAPATFCRVPFWDFYICVFALCPHKTFLVQHIPLTRPSYDACRKLSGVLTWFILPGSVLSNPRMTA